MWADLVAISDAFGVRRGATLAVLAVVLAALPGCVTVRPQERAMLADPKMRFQGDPRAAAAQAHAIENREGSFGGGSVEGGGCGCN
jgi:hypothetical protein